MDYTILYVTLARAVGLQTDFVLVQQDYQGVQVAHACAGLVLNEKSILIDLAYDSFGAPHRVFRFMGDVEAAGLVLVNSGVEHHDLDLQRAGLKLAPDCAFARFMVALTQVLPDRINFALKLDSSRNTGSGRLSPFLQSQGLAFGKLSAISQPDCALHPSSALGNLVRAAVRLSRDIGSAAGTFDLETALQNKLDLPGIMGRVRLLLAAGLLQNGDLEGALGQCDAREQGYGRRPCTGSVASKLSQIIRKVMVDSRKNPSDAQTQTAVAGWHEHHS
ncbi:MAG TPA: hypothetical protein VG167_04300 [Verrucomicrobiae bacterium]|nr:hypothetical protein [Verrucomicrobiae bacterium]